MSAIRVITGPSRRRLPRISVTEDVWVYWESPPLRDISRVRDLGPGGLFLETRARREEGDRVRLHFLVGEGQIRAEAEVRHVKAGQGMGVKINSVNTQDVPHLDRLLLRLREVRPLMRNVAKPAKGALDY